MKIILICLVLLVALIAYGNQLKKKKKELIEEHSNKVTCEFARISKFTMEHMLQWYKAHPDFQTSDIYVLSKVTPEILNYGALKCATGPIDEANSIAMMVMDESRNNVKRMKVVEFQEIDSDILALLGDKQMVILE